MIKKQMIKENKIQTISRDYNLNSNFFKLPHFIHQEKIWHLILMNSAYQAYKICMLDITTYLTWLSKNSTKAVTGLPVAPFALPD